MRISVIGSGYVGTVIGACLASIGNKVRFIDTDEEKVESINNRKPMVHEEGLCDILNQVRPSATTDYWQIIDADIIFLCVGTPVSEDGSMCLEQLAEATEQIAKVLEAKRDYCVVVVKSSVPPGTTEELVIPLLQKSARRIGKDFGVCMSPEFLREGKAVYDFMNPARIIIGEYDVRSGEVLVNLHRGLEVPMLRTNLRTAEMIKLASNTFLATKISFINEIGNICKRSGVDTYEVAKGMGFDDRIGSRFLDAGVGFGGSCLPKDLMGLIAASKRKGYEPRLLQEVLNLNDMQTLMLVELVEKLISLNNATIGVLGLAFKPATDDIRYSRAIHVVHALLEKGAKVKAFDPKAMENFRALFPQIEYVSAQDVLNSDAVVIMTEWPEFNDLDYKGKVVIDGRRIPKAKMGAQIYEGLCW